MIRKIIIKLIWKLPISWKKLLMQQVLTELTRPTLWVDSTEEFGDKVTVKTLRKRISIYH